jgi:hypothetical protein
MPTDKLNRFSSVFRLANNREPRIHLQKRTQTLSNHGVIFGQYYCDGIHILGSD